MLGETRETSARISSLAAGILGRQELPESDGATISTQSYNILLAQAKRVAGSALAQDPIPGQGEPNFIDRLQREHDALDEKIANLTTFLGHDDNDASDVQRSLLEVQLSTMIVYRRVLEMRLNLLTGEKS